MSSRHPPRSPRIARSPEVAARLERSRARSKQRRELARQRERAIHEAVKRYLACWAAITACETARDRDVAALRQQISDLEARAASEIARYRADQAEAAAVIRERGGSEEDIADLLEISLKEVRQLLTAARTHPNPTTPQPPSRAAASSEPSPSGDPAAASARPRTPPITSTASPGEPPVPQHSVDGDEGRG
ncbi:hypothetical protein [Nocardia araoensis]|uniref:hypothetical protein n=1 Tax=Nocardia araoensis TaxID=228600 RepID=UPI000303C6B1|nr:hypothetical protein [Nocardia araoensis]